MDLFTEFVSNNLDDAYFGDCEVREVLGVDIDTATKELLVHITLEDPVGQPMDESGYVVYQDGVFNNVDFTL